MKRIILALLLLAVPVWAHALITLTVKDMNSLVTEVYTDAATPNFIFLPGTLSPIMSTYWAGSLQIDIANVGGGDAVFLSASTNLDALVAGSNVELTAVASGFVSPPAGEVDFRSSSNASVVTNTSYTVSTMVDATQLLAPTVISDVVTTALAEDTITVGSPFGITHRFLLTAADVGGSLAFDAGTFSGDAIPAPAPLALLAAGLIGLGFVRSRA
jgi:hypothetical protein